MLTIMMKSDAQNATAEFSSKPEQTTSSQRLTVPIVKSPKQSSSPTSQTQQLNRWESTNEM